MYGNNDPEHERFMEEHERDRVNFIHECERKRRAQPAPVQEPVAWIHKQTGVITTGWSFDKDLFDPLYTHPQPQREWVGLSKEEIDKLKHLIDWTATWSHGRFAYEIDQLLKEKNT
jgi:hypothetical protein